MTTDSPASSQRKAKRRGAGEGSVFRRADGYWVATITTGRSPDGKRNRRTIYGKTKREVTEELTRLQNRKLDRTLCIEAQQRVADYFSTWVENETRLSPSTKNRYRGIVTKHINPNIGGLKLSDLTPAHVEAFMLQLRDKGASEETVLYAYSVLHRGLERLVKQRRLPVHPCNAVDRPKVERQARGFLDADKADALLTAAEGHRLRAVFVLALTTGMRQGELFGLQWEDVDLEAGTLSVRHSLEEVKGQLRLKDPKSKAGKRPVKLPRVAVDALHDRWALAMAEDAAGVSYVFCDTQGNPLRKSNFQRRVWEPLKKAAKLPSSIRFHDLRHTSASLMLKEGINPKVVQERLGHADIRLTLNTYSHVMQGMQEQAAAVFDGMFGGKRADGYKVATNSSDTTSENEKPLAEDCAPQGVA